MKLPPPPLSSSLASLSNPASYMPRGRSAPMTNAQRQQRWRDKHRPRRHRQWDANGNLLSPFTNPNLRIASSPPAQPPAPTTSAPAVAEHNYCPHCGSALRKRAKRPKLAA